MQYNHIGSQRQMQYNQGQCQEEQKRESYNRNLFQKVQQRESYNRGLYKQATPYFFTNFPEDWSYADMWRTFLAFGRVYDIYSPNRKSRNDSRFGFVRFLDVKNKKELERHLDQIWIGGRKLWVNIPRYNEEMNEKGEKRNKQVLETRTQYRSYAEVVSGQGKNRVYEERKFQSNEEQSRGRGRSRSRSRPGNRSEGNRKIWQQIGKREDWVGIEYIVKSEDYSWLDGCYVGTAHSVEMVRNLQEKFYMEGYFSCRIRAMGGKLVLLDCEDKEELKDLVELGANWLGQWFEEVRPWTPDMVSKERFVWMRCQGVPLNAWEPDFFATMGCAWGKFICLDDSTSKRKRFDIARFLISTPIMNTISVMRQVKVNGIIYNIKFTEEEFTNSFFSLKQDFMPTFQSESEEHESWSMDSDIEEQEFENAGDVGKGEMRSPGTEVEDDDVASFTQETKKRLRSQAEEKEEKSIEVVGDSLEEIQILIDGEGREEAVGTMQMQRHGECHKSAGFEEESRKQLGFREQTKEKPSREPKANSDISPTMEESTNMALAQVSRSGNTKSVTNEEDYRNRGSASENDEREGEDPFWKGFESEEGRLKEWMGRKNEGIPKKKKRRIRSCKAVYLSARAIGEDAQRRKGRGKQRKKKTGGKTASEDTLYSNEEAVGGSLGVVAENEEEVIQKIEEMEDRDRRAKEKMVMKDAGDEKRIRDIVRKERIQFLALQETKMEVVDRKVCRKIWGTDEYDWIMKPSEGLSGGLLCIWSSKVFKKKNVLEGRNYIGVYGLWGEEETPVYILNIYSSCLLTDKRALWEELQMMITTCRGNWCLMGDFNAVRNTKQRAGCKGFSREMRDFDCFICEAGLVDLPLVGRKYTWYNANGQQMSRIDRFLLSEDWILNWSDVKQWGLRRTVSDHCPIILKNEMVDWGPKPFKFFDAWLEQPGCIEVIKKAWNSSDEKGWKGYRFKEKLKRTKNALKEWNDNSTTKVDSKINEAEKEIALLDEKGEKDQLSAIDIEKRRKCFIELWKHLKIKDSMWQQKSRMAWLKEGDANTKFFHRCVKGRWRRNEINSIQINDKQHTVVAEIKEEVAKYFEELFTGEQWKRPKLEGIDFKQISSTDSELLMAEFSEDEIKEAVWDCDSSKSPGPDGFNFRFVKAMWEDIKADVVGFVQEFHRNGKLVRGSNASFIVLIPKVDNPQKIEEYRPISLIGVMYKIITKLLDNRLRKVLPKIIGEQQMAFIGGRQLVEGAVVANEIIDEAKRKKMKSFLFKVDFEKAYDKVCWEFIDYMLMRMGFSITWRKWIQECLRSSTVSVLVNGSPTKQFTVSKGLRQGDPLSPFLFLIVAEGLNGLVSSAVVKEQYKGVIVGNGAVSVSHLQFVDDMIFFGEATEENIQAIKCIMRIFELVSGLKINFGKSQLMGIGVGEEWRARMAFRLYCKEGGFPFKYLGIPIGGNHRRITMWQPMVESFKRKLESWKGRHLSFGGRITLINSVLSSLPIFLMSVYLIPKGILLAIDKIRRSFLWGGMGEKKKINWVSWEKVCEQKERGGLGVKELRKFNLALMGKWWGRLASNDEGLWRELIKGKYGNQRDNWMDWVREGRGVGSLWWRDVCCLDTIARDREGWLAEGFRIQLGEGTKVSFWWDNWCGEGCLANRFPRLYILSTGKEKKCNQMGNTKDGMWKWDLAWRRSLFEWEADRAEELNVMIKDTRISPGSPDKWLWTHNNDGKLVKWLWKACAAWWGINVRLESNCWDTFKKLGEGNKDSRIREGWDCIWNALVWSVWLARNQKIFQQSEQKKEKILELIQLRAFLWIKARKARCTFTISDWLNNPTACLTVNNGRKRKRASRTDKTSKHPEFIGFGQNSEKWRNCKKRTKTRHGCGVDTILQASRFRHGRGVDTTQKG
ncbi:hypothetical protein SLEP1_g23168 [Rubroshorea leprosula]|uniref:Uncharacterized protein n=1 Tax=Rubroshorea leprosula TaxID=152421 RepID=A0AAV5JBM8_9ROSI|nr:hypothetical protein SLEP1_g23168 [Rubroshorea leprosula]